LADAQPATNGTALDFLTFVPRTIILIPYKRSYFMTLKPIVIPQNPDTEPRTGFYCAECEQTVFPPYPHKTEGVWHYPASGGGFYEIIPSFADNWACSCPSFHHRGRCKHLFGEEGVYAMEERAKRAQEASQERGGAVKLEDLY
jgi:hypothetical protein